LHAVVSSTTDLAIHLEGIGRKTAPGEMDLSRSSSDTFLASKSAIGENSGQLHFSIWRSLRYEKPNLKQSQRLARLIHEFLASRTGAPTESKHPASARNTHTEKCIKNDFRCSVHARNVAEQ
jgi:hypothetical protein